MEKETKEKLIEFFNDEISAADYARELRRFSMETIKMFLTHDENNHYVNKDWITQGHYWLHRLCEILDPQLED